MSDNTLQNGSDTMASDDIGGVKYQREKIVWGVDGVATDVSAASPLPVDVKTASVTVAVGSALPVGTNKIGSADVVSMPAAREHTDAITTVPGTGAIMLVTGAGATPVFLQPKFGNTAITASGDSTIVAAVTSKKIRIIRMSIVVTAAVTIKLTSALAGSTIYGAVAYAANGGVQESFSPVGICETTAGQALVLNLSGAIASPGVSINWVYVEV